MTDTALAKFNESANDYELMQAIQGLPVEQQKEILAAELRLAISALPQTQSKDFIGVRVNVIDALPSTILDEKATKANNGEPVYKNTVVFVIQDTRDNSLHAVTKSSNYFNDAYVTRFNAWRGIANKPILNMTFEIDEKYSVAGNPAIVLRAFQETQAAKGK